MDKVHGIKSHFSKATEIRKASTANITSFAPLTAKVMEEITLRGTEFGTSTNKVKVMFSGGIIARVKSVTPTQIILYTPVTTETGKIILILNDTTTLTSKEDFAPIISNPEVNPGENPGGNPTGNPTTKPYVVKTFAIAGVGLTTTLVDGKLKALITQYSDGTGNVVDLRSGTGVTVGWVNAGPDKYTVVMNGNTPELICKYNQTVPL